MPQPSWVMPQCPRVRLSLGWGMMGPSWRTGGFAPLAPVTYNPSLPLFLQGPWFSGGVSPRPNCTWDGSGMPRSRWKKLSRSETGKARMSLSPSFYTCFGLVWFGSLPPPQPLVHPVPPVLQRQGGLLRGLDLCMRPRGPPPTGTVVGRGAAQLRLRDSGTLSEPWGGLLPSTQL